MPNSEQSLEQLAERRRRAFQATLRWRSKNRSRVAAYQKTYDAQRQRNYSDEYRAIIWDKDRWLRSALNHARHRAKKAGLEFDIVAADIIVPDVCPVLFIPLKINRGRSPRSNHDSPSLDRVRNDLGYIKGNVKVISARANHLKSNATADELALVLGYVLDSDTSLGTIILSQARTFQEAKAA